MTARLYTRVSTLGQVDNFSLAAQREKLNAYCDYQGWHARAHYEDAGISGSRDDRPDLERLFLELQRGDVVLAYSISRLGRGGAAQILGIVKRIRDAGARLVLPTEGIDTDTPTGRLMLTVLAGLAEIEVETTRERSIMGQEQAVREGAYPLGTTPFGYRKTEDRKRLEIDPDEAAIVQQVFALAPGLPFTQLAAKMRRSRLRAPAVSKAWYPQVVRRIVTNPIYKGEGLFREHSARDNPSRQIPFKAPAIVTAEVWAAAQRTRSRANTHAKPDIWPLTGHLECLCGTAIVGKRRHRERGRWKITGEPHYACLHTMRHRPTCRALRIANPMFQAEPLEISARAVLAAALLDPSDPLAVTSKPRRGEDINAAERSRLRAQLETLLDMRQHGEISREQLTERRAPLERRLRALDAPPEPRPPNAAQNAIMAEAVRHSTNLEFAEILDILEVTFRVQADRKTVLLTAFTPLSDP
jgi:site-specific DNA recombinase